MTTSLDILFLPCNTAIALTISLVLFRLDYCNSLLCGLLSCLISNLQLLQNLAAKTVLQADSSSSSRACLYRLHWLPSPSYFGSLLIFYNSISRLTYLIFFLLDRLMSLSGLRTRAYGCINLSFLTLSTRSFSHIAPFL